MLASGPSAAGLVDVLGTTTSEWLPSQVSTFLVTPLQIEATIGRLQAQYELDEFAARPTYDRSTGAETKAQEAFSNQTLVGLNNWIKVLDSYRASIATSDTSLQASIQAMVDGVGVAADKSGLSQLFSDFNAGMDGKTKGATDYSEFLNAGASRSVPRFCAVSHGFARLGTHHHKPTPVFFLAHLF